MTNSISREGMKKMSKEIIKRRSRGNLMTSRWRGSMMRRKWMNMIKVIGLFSFCNLWNRLKLRTKPRPKSPATPMGMGITPNRRRLSKPKRRPLSNPQRCCNHHLRRSLLRRKGKRLRIPQRHLHPRRQRKQMKEAKDLRDTTHPTLQPLCYTRRK